MEHVPGSGRVEEGAGPVTSTVDPADIRGLGTTLQMSVRRLPRSRLEGRLKPPRNALEDCAAPGPRPFPHPAVIRERDVMLSRRDRDLSGDGPHEGGELACHSGDGDVGMLAACGEAAEAFAQPQLRLPADVLDRLGESLDPFLDVSRDLGGEAVGPGALDESATGVAVAGLGDGALAPALSAGGLARVKTEEGGELAGVVEAGEVADLGDHDGGDGELNAAQSLESLDERIQTPGGDVLFELGVETLDALHLLVDGAHRFLEDDL